MHHETILSLLKDRANGSPGDIAHWTLTNSKNWEPTSWRQYYQRVCCLMDWLKDQGLKPGQPIGIMAPTNQQWDFLQMAVLAAGGVVVGIDPHDRAENIGHILHTAKLTGLIIGETSLLDKVSAQDQQALQFIICIDASPKDTNGNNVIFLPVFDDVNLPPAKELLNLPEPQQPATIIFTSGTTGVPKGIMYTHEQVFLACEAIRKTFHDIKTGSRLVCWLPLSNLFQRIMNFCAIKISAQTYFVTNPTDIMTLMPDISPHLFLAVPRFFEKLYEGMMHTINGSPPWIRFGFKTAQKIGHRYAHAQRQKISAGIFIKLLHQIVDAVFLKRIRRIMGSDIQYMISGSAPMPQWLLEWFHSIGWLILEAYGISENIIPNTANRPDDYKFGTVGKPLPGNEIIIAEDGELLVKSRGVYNGYLNSTEPQADITENGFLCTGDFAVMDDKGFIRLTGRKSDIFKTSTGRRIAPVAIENVLRQISCIDQAVVLGAGRKFLTAIISLSDGVFDSDDEEKESERRISEGKMSTPIEKMLHDEIVRQTASLPAYQRPAGYLITTKQFTIEGEELTSNLKVRRKFIEAKFSDQIQSLYNTIDEAKTSGGMVIKHL